MQNSNFDRSQNSSHKSLSYGYETKEKKLKVVKQNLSHNDSSSCTATINPDFVISCKESFMAYNNIVKTG